MDEWTDRPTDTDGQHGYRHRHHHHHHITIAIKELLHLNYWRATDGTNGFIEAENCYCRRAHRFGQFCERFSNIYWVFFFVFSPDYFLFEYLAVLLCRYNICMFVYRFVCLFVWQTVKFQLHWVAAFTYCKWCLGFLLFFPQLTHIIIITIRISSVCRLFLSSFSIFCCRVFFAYLL